MQIRYTAGKDLQTADNAISVYNFGTADGYFASGSSYVDHTDAIRITASVHSDALDATWQKVFSVNGMFSLYFSDERVRVFFNHDTGYNHTTLVPYEGRENRVTFVWDGSDTYEIILNGASETGTTSTTIGAGTGALEIGSDVSGNNIDGYLFDVELEVNGTVTGTWGCQDGSGTDFADSTGAETLSLTGTGSPLPTGWESVTLAHYADFIYTLPVNLKTYDRTRKPVQRIATSLSGVQKTTADRTDIIYSCATIPLQNADFRNMREFLSSTVNGQRFEFDDGNGFTWCVLVGQPTETRAVRHGDGGSTDHFSFSWQHREIYTP